MSVLIILIPNNSSKTKTHKTARGGDMARERRRACALSFLLVILLLVPCVPAFVLLTYKIYVVENGAAPYSNILLLLYSI